MMPFNKSKTCGSQCTAPVPHEDTKSATVPSSNVPTDCDVTPLESERKNCVASGINIYENSYECKLNGGSVRFIQRICVPSAFKHGYRNENLKPSKLVDNDKTSTQPESSNIVNKYPNENIEHASSKQSPITASNNNNQEVLTLKDKTQASDKVVMQRETQATIEESLSLVKEPMFFSTKNYGSNPYKGCQNAGVGQSHQLIDIDKPPAKQADDFKTKEYSSFNDDIAIDQGDKHMRKDKILMAKDKAVQNDCCCKNSNLQQLQLTNNDDERKGDSKFKNKEQSSQIQSLIAADQNNEMLIINKGAILPKDKVIKQKQESKRQKNLKKKPIVSTIETCACNDCQSSDAEQSQLVSNDKTEDHFKFKNKDLKHAAPKQSLISTDQNYELLLLKEEKDTKGKVILQKERKPERMSLAKGATSSSTGMCDPDICKFCQSFIEEKSQLVDNDNPPAKQKVDFKHKYLEHQFPNQHLDNHEVPMQQKDKSLMAKEKVASNACTCRMAEHDKFPTKLKSNFKDVEHSPQIHSLIAADQNNEMLIGANETILPKDKIIIQKDKRTERRKSTEKKPASSFIEICDCKVCENSDMEQSQVVDSDEPSSKSKDYFEIKNKDLKDTAPQELLLATDQNHELLILKEEKEDIGEVITQKDRKLERGEDLAEGPKSSSTGVCDHNVCSVCQNVVIQQSQLVDKPQAKQKGVFKHKNVEHPLLPADEKPEVLTQKDKSRNKKTVSSACTGTCQNLDSDQEVNNDKPPAKPDTGFKFKNTDVEHPSPKQSLIVAEESLEKLILTDLEKRQKKKSPKRIKSLTKRPTFSSIGFLLKHLGKFRNPQLTKTEIAKYETRKEQWDRLSVGELPKLGFYGTKEKRLFNYGERGSGFKTSGEVQDFYKLRDYHLSIGTLFEDPEFPPIDSSLFYKEEPDHDVEWKRPGELVQNPQFFADGYSRFDIKQGSLGDCWLLAAAANLTLYRKLFFQVVPADQGFDKNYAGIFHFRFWKYGRWVDIVIDDRLPTNRAGRLIFLHATEDNKFWSALLEKAYAKLHGSYEALIAGLTCEAMEDFTGGVKEYYLLAEAPLNFFKAILKSYERCSLISCGIFENPDVVEDETAEGLVRGHAYSITKINYIDIHTPNIVGKLPLLRLRNPWGDESEWNGAWSDKSPEWRFISDKEKEKLGLTFDDDGEFWMSFRDFMKHFQYLEICNLPPDLLTEEKLIEVDKKKWEMSVFEGEWVRGVTAGGCRNFLDTYWMNPQYRITLTDPDEEDGDNRCTIIVALMQKHVRAQKKLGINHLVIGFDIYYLLNPDRMPKHLDSIYFSHHQPVEEIMYGCEREVSHRFRLQPGAYCIVASTYMPDDERQFVMRVFSEQKNNMEADDEEFKIADDETSQEPIATKKNVETLQASQDGDQAKEMFLKYAGDDMEIDWMGLKQILDHTMQSELTESGFSKDICRSMVAMMDVDRSGKLGFREFRVLWANVCKWKLVFTTSDKDKSGALSGTELRNAFKSTGYHLNSHILNILMHRYGSSKRVIEFDDFIMCAIKLKTLMQIFKEKDPLSSNAAEFSLEEWMENTLYA